MVKDFINIFRISYDLIKTKWDFIIYLNHNNSKAFNNRLKYFRILFKQLNDFLEFSKLINYFIND